MLSELSKLSELREILRAKKRSDPSAVILLCEAGLENNPKDETLLYFMAEAYEASGRIDLAIETLDRCIELSPDSFEYLATAAQWLAKDNQHGEAYNYAEKALLHKGSDKLPRLLVLVLKAISFVLGKRNDLDVNEQLERSESRKVQWLRDYTLWYRRETKTADDVDHELH